MKILFPHIPPTTTNRVLCDLVTRLTSRRSRSTDGRQSRIASAKVIRIQDSAGSSEYFGLIEPVSEDDGRYFLAIANQLGRRHGFVVAREFRERGPKNPFIPSEADGRRPGLKVEVVADNHSERIPVQ